MEENEKITYQCEGHPRGLCKNRIVKGNYCPGCKADIEAEKNSTPTTWRLNFQNA